MTGREIALQAAGSIMFCVKRDRKYEKEERQEHMLKQVSLVVAEGLGWKRYGSLVWERNCGGSARQLVKNSKLI